MRVGAEVGVATQAVVALRRGCGHGGHQRSESGGTHLPFATDVVLGRMAADVLAAAVRTPWLLCHGLLS